MHVISKKMDGSTITTAEIKFTIDRKLYGAMNKAVFDQTGKTLLEILKQRLCNELEKAHDTLKSVQAL